MMKSKTILAAVIAGALAAPLAVLADDGASSPCSPGDQQSSTQSGSSDDGQLAQNDTDNSLIAGPSGNSENPYGSTGDPNLRQSSARA